MFHRKRLRRSFSSKFKLLHRVIDPHNRSNTSVNVCSSILSSNFKHLSIYLKFIITELQNISDSFQSQFLDSGQLQFVGNVIYHILWTSNIRTKLNVYRSINSVFIVIFFARNFEYVRHWQWLMKQCNNK